MENLTGISENQIWGSWGTWGSEISATFLWTWICKSELEVQKYLPSFPYWLAEII